MGSHCTEAKANLTKIRLLPQNNYEPYVFGFAGSTTVITHFFSRDSC